MYCYMAEDGNGVFIYDTVEYSINHFKRGVLEKSVRNGVVISGFKEKKFAVDSNMFIHEDDFCYNSDGSMVWYLVGNRMYRFHIRMCYIAYWGTGITLCEGIPPYGLSIVPVKGGIFVLQKGFPYRYISNSALDESCSTYCNPDKFARVVLLGS